MGLGSDKIKDFYIVILNVNNVIAIQQFPDYMGICLISYCKCTMKKMTVNNNKKCYLRLCCAFLFF